MKTIQIPAQIQIGDFKFTFKNFVDYLIDGHPKWNKTGKGIREGSKIQNLLSGSEVSFVLDDDLWLALKEVAEDPGEELGYPAVYARDDKGNQNRINISKLLLPFIDAITEAE